MAGSNLRRQAARRDANEAPLVHYLRERGAMVCRVSAADVPDLLVGYCGLWWPVEVKRPRKELNPGQARFAGDARRHGLPVGLIRDEVEAEQLLRAMRDHKRNPL